MKKVFVLLTFAALVCSMSFGQVKVLNNGNVGVGTTSPVTKFQIGNMWTFYDGPNDKIIGKNTYYNGSNNVRITTGIASRMYFSGSGEIVFQTVESGAANSIVNNWNTFIMKNNGNVGIGTTSPSRQLHVRGETFIDAYNTPNWGSALRAKVYQSNACAYNLEYNGQDRFYVCAQGYAWAYGNYYLGSDSIFKSDIRQIESPLSKLKLINGVEYYLKSENAKEDERKKHFGVVAQEVEKIFPEVVKTMYDGTKAVAYMEFVGLLIEGIKELSTEVETLESRINKLENIVSNCCNTTIQPKSMQIEEGNSQSYLEQNAPNPFSTETKIKYFISETRENAILYIFNLQGVLKLQKPIYQTGEGTITISGSELEVGMYIYTLTVNGKEVDTKKMILTK